MEPQIVEKGAFSVVGLKLRCGMEQPNDFPRLWGQIFERMGEVRGIVENGVSYGVMDNYNAATGSWDYVAGFSVEADGATPEGMVKTDIPAATYAVFACTLPTIQATYDMIYQQWLPQSGYEHAPVPELERYGTTFNPDDPDSTYDIYIPVVGK